MRVEQLWSTFRRLPVWLQVVLVVGGSAWIAAYAGGGGPAPATDRVAAQVQAPADGSDVATAQPDETRPAGSTETATEASSGAGTPSARSSESPGPVPAASPSRTAAPRRTPQPAAATWTVTHIVDGDTVDVRAADGTIERVRVIGIDTPERGECGFTEAGAALAALVLDAQVELAPGARADRDRYGRILRYLDVGPLDAGLSLIEDGYAIARYDSRDGYGRHPREDAYVAADAASPAFTCAAPEPSPSPSPRPASEPSPTAPAEPAPAANPWGTSSCDPAYDPCVPPPSEVGDLNCPDIERHYPNGVAVDHAHGDPHRLDRDRDGRGCE